MIKYDVGPVTPAEEVFHAKDDFLIKKIKSINRVSKDEFEKLVQPGDILITYIDAKKLSFLKKLTMHVTSWAQASSFTSCKMIGENGEEIIGYDVLGRGLELRHYKVRSFLNRAAGIVVLRNKKIDKNKQDSIVAWMKKREKMKIPYSMYTVLISALKHFFSIFRTKQKEPTKEDLLKYREPSFCSSIVEMAYDAFGIDTGVGKEVGKSYVWPVDFLYSDKFKVVCGYFIPGELDWLDETDKK